MKSVLKYWRDGVCAAHPSGESVWRWVCIRVCLFHIFVAFTSCFLPACTDDDGIKKRLADIETILQTSPDRALGMLGEIDRQGLSRRLAAHHALLYTEAMHQSGKPLAGDTLIRTAWQYYKHHSHDADKQYKTLYYWGCVKLQEQDEQEALKHLLEAEEILRHHPDAHYQGLLYLRIGDIYFNEADFRQANYFFGESHRYFTLAHDVTGQAKALIRLGDVANTMPYLQKAIQLYTQALDLADDIPDVELAHMCLKNLVPLYFITGKEVPADMMRHMEAFARQSSDHIRLDIQLLRHRPDSARYYLHRMEQQIAHPQDRIDYHHAGYWTELFADDTRAATRHLHRYFALKDSVAQINAQLSAGEIRRAYFDERLRFADFKMLNRTLWFLAFILVMAVIAISVAYHQRQMIRMHQLRNDSYLHTVNEAQEAYRVLSEQVNKNQEYLMKDLTARFRVIERIGQTYYKQENTIRQKDAIYQEVKNIIKDISSDQALRLELEQVVDNSRQNAMQRLRRAYPAMKDSDLRLLCYTFCGFSPQIITLFTSETIENVYARKSRLKSRIKNSDSPDREFFLALFR